MNRAAANPFDVEPAPGTEAPTGLGWPAFFQALGGREPSGAPSGVAVEPASD